MFSLPSPGCCFLCSAPGQLETFPLPSSLPTPFSFSSGLEAEQAFHLGMLSSPLQLFAPASLSPHPSATTQVKIQLCRLWTGDRIIHPPGLGGALAPSASGSELILAVPLLLWGSVGLSQPSLHLALSPLSGRSAWLGRNLGLSESLNLGTVGLLGSSVEVMAGVGLTGLLLPERKVPMAGSVQK